MRNDPAQPGFSAPSLVSRRISLMMLSSTAVLVACGGGGGSPTPTPSPAPPPSLDPKWWGPHTGYTLAKMGMSFVTLGLAAEFAGRGVAINALWPRTIIATDALNLIPGVDIAGCRTPAIVADAAHAVLTTAASARTGAFLIDEDVLRETGISDFDGYAVEPGRPLLPDLFL